MIAALTATAVMTGAMAVTAGAEGHVFGYTCMDLTNPFHIATHCYERCNAGGS